MKKETEQLIKFVTDQAMRCNGTVMVRQAVVDRHGNETITEVKVVAGELKNADGNTEDFIPGQVL